MKIKKHVKLFEDLERDGFTRVAPGFDKKSKT